jgi:hypothetical protein
MQLPLPINSEFELITAEQLAWSKGRDDVTDEDLRQAVKMVARWNLIRKQRNQLEIL